MEGWSFPVQLTLLSVEKAEAFCCTCGESWSGDHSCGEVAATSSSCGESWSGDHSYGEVAATSSSYWGSQSETAPTFGIGTAHSLVGRG